jgi:hypothetical protein
MKDEIAEDIIRQKISELEAADMHSMDTEELWNRLNVSLAGKKAKGGYRIYYMAAIAAALAALVIAPFLFWNRNADIARTQPAVKTYIQYGVPEKSASPGNGMQQNGGDNRSSGIIASYHPPKEQKSLAKHIKRKYKTQYDKENARIGMIASPEDAACYNASIEEELICY